jgi:formyl-CoA transferase
VRTIPEIVAEEHLQNRALFLPVAPPPDGPKGFTLNTGFKFASDLEASAGGSMAAPPRLGQHTHSILAELGYSAAEIQRLRAASVV